MKFNDFIFFIGNFLNFDEYIKIKIIFLSVFACDDKKLGGTSVSNYIALKVIQLLTPKLVLKIE